MTFPCPYCHKSLRLSDDDVISEAAAIHNSRRKVHAGGRPVGYRKCPKCGKFHQKETKCQTTKNALSD